MVSQLPKFFGGALTFSDTSYCTRRNIVLHKESLFCLFMSRLTSFLPIKIHLGALTPLANMSNLCNSLDQIEDC